jgi:hypothetical protein
LTNAFLLARCIGFSPRPNSPGNGPDDQPTPYPHVLDYRERQWAQVQLTPPAAAEIRVERDQRGGWEPGKRSCS